jgi:hypothetical protein
MGEESCGIGAKIYNLEVSMTHEQLIAECTQWFWNTFPEERRMLYAVNNNVSAGLTKQQQIVEGNKNKAKGVVAGVLDLCYICYDGRSVYLDAKVGNDTLSKEQEDFCEKLDDRGIAWFLFSSFGEFIEIMETIRNG